MPIVQDARVGFSNPFPPISSPVSTIERGPAPPNSTARVCAAWGWYRAGCWTRCGSLYADQWKALRAILPRLETEGAGREGERERERESVFKIETERMRDIQTHTQKLGKTFRVNFPIWRVSERKGKKSGGKKKAITDLSWVSLPPPTFHFRLMLLHNRNYGRGFIKIPTNVTAGKNIVEIEPDHDIWKNLATIWKKRGRYNK